MMLSKLIWVRGRGCGKVQMAKKYLIKHKEKVMVSDEKELLRGMINDIECKGEYFKIKSFKRVPTKSRGRWRNLVYMTDEFGRIHKRKVSASLFNWLKSKHTYTKEGLGL